MLKFLLRRSLFLIWILFAVSLLIFLIVNILPGDVTISILGPDAPPDQLAQLRRNLGLDDPVLQRYLVWIAGFLRGDFGVSLVSRQEIAPLLLQRLGNSAILAGLTLVIAIPLAIVIGVICSMQPGSLLDRISIWISTTSLALPDYITGLALLLLFSIWLPLLPGSSILPPGVNPLTRLDVLVLPTITLVLSLQAFLMQITRASMIDQLQAKYVRTATLKGLPRAVVVFKHALPNALPPTISQVGLLFGHTLGGLVVVEALFSFDGVGRLMLTAIETRDIPLIQATVLLVAAGYGAGNLIADLISAVLNPKLRARR